MKDFNLQQCSTPVKHAGDIKILKRSNNINQPLFCCSKFSDENLLCLVLGLYSGIPKNYHILKCQDINSEEELKLFLNRSKLHFGQYVLVGVNKLPFNLQEVRPISNTK